MAYKLPSIFHVKLTEDGNQLILFKARVRTELENKLNGLYGEYIDIILSTLYTYNIIICTYYIFIKH